MDFNSDQLISTWLHVEEVWNGSEIAPIYGYIS